MNNIARLAIEGYSVQAMDFIIKPITFTSFSLKMQNLLKSIQNQKQKKIVLIDEHGWKKISTDELCYAEIAGHYISYHTIKGLYRQKGSLKELEESLMGLTFKRCNNCYLVNLKYVNSIQKDEVLVGEDWLKISRPRKKVFLQALANYMGGIQV